MNLDEIEHKAKTSSVGAGAVIELVALVRRQPSASRSTSTSTASSRA